MDSIGKKFRVESGKKFKLKDQKTGYTANIEKEDGPRLLEELKLELSGLQEKLYAANKQSLLIIFQAMDAAGKDSAVEHIMSGINPQGCQVFSFKQPSAEESDHDFLWRHYKALPEKGRIGIHNRSHYENVLICKVHPELAVKDYLPGLKKDEKLPASFWEQRYESIRSFEKHLAENGTAIIKFFLNVSREEQKERFLARIDDPAKNWKFSAADVHERSFWSDYMAAYEEAISKTSADHAPWYVIPADKKWFTRIAITQIIVATLKKMDPQFPKLAPEDIAALSKSRGLLESEL